jgi:hypothetical protein
MFARRCSDGRACAEWPSCRCTLAACGSGTFQVSVKRGIRLGAGQCGVCDVGAGGGGGGAQNQNAATSCKACSSAGTACGAGQYQSGCGGWLGCWWDHGIELRTCARLHLVVVGRHKRRVVPVMWVWPVPDLNEPPLYFLYRLQLLGHKVRSRATNLDRMRRYVAEGWCKPLRAGADLLLRSCLCHARILAGCLRSLLER